MKKYLKLAFYSLVLVSLVVLAGCKKKPEYVYSFNSNGGSDIASVTLEEGKTYTLPTPTKDGYKFMGWYSSEDLSGDILVSITSSTDSTLYAKWEKLYTVTLNLNGGSLSVSSLELTKDDNLYTALSALNPTLSSCTFSGWYKGNNKVSLDDLVGAANITVTAKFTQEYTLECYLKNLDDDNYTKVTQTGSAFVGETFTANLTQNGFKEVTNSNTVDSIVVSSNKNSNVLKKYYERESYNVVFNYNYPEETQSETKEESYLFGESYTVPTDLSYYGYVLIGWMNEEGEMVHSFNTLATKTFNKEKETLDEIKEEVSSNVTYTAVWQKGYTNMFGGVDVIFLIDSKIYLLRGNTVFEGTYFKQSNKFTFENSKEDILIQGILNDNETFVYSSEERSTQEFTQYIVLSGLNEKVKLHMDSYNGFKYTVAGEGDTYTMSSGYYVTNGDNTFMATFTEGERTGETFNFMVGSVSGKNAFQIRDEKSVELGSLYYYYVNNSVLDINNDYTLTMNGYGQATLGASTYIYKYNDDLNEISLYSTTNGQLTNVLRVIEVNGVKGFALYNASLDNTFINSNESLVLDGLTTATYVTEDDEVEGYYNIETSIFGSPIITFTTEYGDFYKFKLDMEVDGDVTKYKFSRLDEDYKELLYQDAKGSYYAPLLVLENSTSATLYGFVKKDAQTNLVTFQKISSGTISFNASTNKYLYEAVEFETIPEDITVATEPIDSLNLKAIEFKVTKDSSYSFSYWYNSTDKENNTTTYSKEYQGTGANEGVTLELVGKIATVKLTSGEITGTFTLNSSGIVTLTVADKTYYFELDEVESKFTQINNPTSFYLYQDGKTNRNIYLFVDKNSEYSYNEVIDSETTNTIAGTVELVRTTPNGTPVNKFTSTDGTVEFEYIALSQGTNRFFAKYDKDNDVTFESIDYRYEGATLTLDGFNFRAYYEINGNEIPCSYVVNEDGTLTITITSGGYNYNYIFDVDYEAKTFKIRGTEAKTYLFFKNQQSTGLVVTLDGYSKASIFKYVEDGREFIDENGTYTIVDNTYIEIVYTSGVETITLRCYPSQYTSGNYIYNTMLIQDEVIIKNFVNEKDFSILSVDAYGNALVINSQGVASRGTAMFVTDTMIYYVNSDASDACIYTYNTNNGTIRIHEYKVQSYYTETFDSLLFSKYGFAIFNNNTRYYYEYEGDDVIIYHSDRENPLANEYGFVRENFGSFDNVKEYDGKTYYINTGYAIQFNREEATKDNYPVKLNNNSTELYPLEGLYFAPNGQEFTVTAIANINNNGAQIRGTVTRKLNDDNETYSMYFQSGNYIWDIEVKYGGLDAESGDSLSTYVVTGLRYELNLPAYEFISLVYIYYAFLGQDASNQTNPYGSLYLVSKYKADGSLDKEYITSSFTDKLNFTDSLGNRLNFDEAPFIFNIANDGTIYIKAEIEALDGYTYRFYFKTSKIDQPRVMTGIETIAVVRLQNFTSNGYSIETEQIVNYKGYVDPANKNYGEYIGQLYGVTIINTETEERVKVDIMLTDNQGDLYVVDRVRDEETGLITKTTYYKLTLTKATKDTEVDDTSYIAEYKTCEVVKYNATTYYSSDNKSYVDILEDGTMKAIYKDSEFVAYSSLSYNEETDTYTYVVKDEDDNASTWNVKIVEGVLTFTEVVTEEVTE